MDRSLVEGEFDDYWLFLVKDSIVLETNFDIFVTMDQLKLRSTWMSNYPFTTSSARSTVEIHLGNSSCSVQIQVLTATYVGLSWLQMKSLWNVREALPSPSWDF